jgi:uncharacterized surface protein with fasciclin (FAS1) repeats
MIGLFVAMAAVSAVMGEVAKHEARAKAITAAPEHLKAQLIAKYAEQDAAAAEERRHQELVDAAKKKEDLSPWLALAFIFGISL